MSDSGLKLPIRTESDVRAERRERALADIRTAGEAEGVSKRMLDEVDSSMRGAFVFSDMLDNLFRPTAAQTWLGSDDLTAKLAAFKREDEAQ